MADEFGGRFMRKTKTGFVHFCPACDRTHPLFADKGWTFNGDFDNPTFTGSFSHQLHNYYDGRKECVVRVSGTCHYTITAAVIRYYADCSHEYRDRSVPLPDLPEYFRNNLI